MLSHVEASKENLGSGEKLLLSSELDRAAPTGGLSEWLDQGILCRMDRFWLDRIWLYGYIAI
jgi:hypothetical protein